MLTGRLRSLVVASQWSLLSVLGGVAVTRGLLRSSLIVSTSFRFQIDASVVDTYTKAVVEGEAPPRLSPSDG
ncbi:hypothetical protein GW17_00015075 [Ensete ventricosum]|nr:hypothetical protein GW17_00015075 [Ensete ventricosum]